VLPAIAGHRDRVERALAGGELVEDEAERVEVRPNRGALAGKLLKDLGYDQVYNLGGFKEWADSGGAVDK